MASSCASLLRSSGLSISASAWPFLTASPATTFSVTVPPAMAYSTGLLAAMTRPSAEMSRTRSPRVTSAMRTREASTDRLPALQPDATQPASSSSPRPRAAGEQPRTLDSRQARRHAGARGAPCGGNRYVLAGGVADAHAWVRLAKRRLPSVKARDRANRKPLIRNAVRRELSARPRGRDGRPPDSVRSSSVRPAAPALSRVH